MKTTTCKPLEKLWQVFYWSYATTTEYCWIIKADSRDEAIKITELYVEENGISKMDGEIEPEQIDLICLDTHAPDYPKNIADINSIDFAKIEVKEYSSLKEFTEATGTIIKVTK